MKTYDELANTVIISAKKNRLLQYDESLTLIGTGRSAFAFLIKSSNKVIKIFFPNFTHIAQEETDIYKALQDISYFPKIYGSGHNYLVMDYIDGCTLFECIQNGNPITIWHINEIDLALSLALHRGLNPSDIHLRNIMITTQNEIKIIDVARFKQTKKCKQWHDLKLAYHHVYSRRFFPKKIPATLMNVMAFFYKKLFIPMHSITKIR